MKKLQNLPRQKKVAYILLALAVVILALAVATPRFPWNRKAGSYEDCVKQGNIVLYSYPSVCVTRDGQRFTNPAEQVQVPR